MSVLWTVEGVAKLLSDEQKLSLAIVQLCLGSLAAAVTIIPEKKDRLSRNGHTFHRRPKRTSLKVDDIIIFMSSHDQLT